MGEIYKITNKVNGKIYIGKTKRTSHIRWIEHIRDSKNYPQKNIPLHKAIQKYGVDNFLCEILEDNIPLDNLNKKEKAYIKKYKTTNSNLGYNCTQGGDGGTVYSKLSENDVKEIKAILQNINNTLSLDEISKSYMVSKNTISLINTGKTWFDPSLKYPLRKTPTRNIGITKELYKNIVNDLLDEKFKMKEIQEKYKVSPSLINSINQGKHCYNKNNSYYSNVYNGKYPIRTIKQNIHLEVDFNNVFHEVLFSNKSIIQIEKDFNIPFNGLRYIILGKRRRELTTKYIVPMREHIEENRKIWNILNGGRKHALCTNS